MEIKNFIIKKAHKKSVRNGMRRPLTDTNHADPNRPCQRIQEREKAIFRPNMGLRIRNGKW